MYINFDLYPIYIRNSLSYFLENCNSARFCCLSFSTLFYLTAPSRSPMATIYQPLQNLRSIRLIELKPAEWKAPIECRLLIDHLDAKPVYHALSYAWGSARVTRPVKLNGAEVRVTVNLESALRHLRHRYTSQILWIDALVSAQGTLHSR